MKPTALSVLVLLVLPAVGAAQLPDLPTFGRNWVDVSYPKLFYGPREGLTIGLYYGQVRPFGYADWDSPPPFRGSVSIDGQISTSGSKRVGLGVWFPQMADGWRFAASLVAERRARENYFGIGNDTPGEIDSLKNGRSHFFRSDNRRLYLRGEVQRRVVGPIRILGGFHLEGWRVDTLSGPTLLSANAAAGIDPTIGANVFDASVRIGVVVDLRDDEVAPRRGALLEIIHGVADASVAGDASYTRTTASAAGYVPMGNRIVLAGRVLAQTMGGTPRIGNLYRIESSDRPVVGMGGASSHRALADRRLLGPDKFLTNFDVRVDAFTIPTLATLTVVGFIDTGRVFEKGGLELTGDDLKVGGGAGVMLRIGRAGLLGGTFGHGPDGLVSQFHAAWTY